MFTAQLKQANIRTKQHNSNYIKLKKKNFDLFYIITHIFSLEDYGLRLMKIEHPVS